MKRMMIVDDSLIIRRRIKRAHGMDEFTVVGSASDGEQAITLARKTNPDIITIDLTMPNMDGTEAIPALASICPEARILVVSALADKATAITALSGGAHGFLCKPFTDNELHQALLELTRD